MVIGIRDDSDVRGHGYILPPPPQEIAEDLRRRWLKIVELQEKLKTAAIRTTRGYIHLKDYVELSVQDMKSCLAENDQPAGISPNIGMVSLVGGVVVTGFGLLSNPSTQSEIQSAASLFRNPDVLKGLCIAAGVSLMIAGVVCNYSSINWRKYKLHWCLNEIHSRRGRYFESLMEAYNVAEDLKGKSRDARYSELFVEMFPIDSEHYRIANEMFNMTKQSSDFILENSRFGNRNRTAAVVGVVNMEMISELISRVQQDMALVENAKNALPNLHSYR